MAAKFKTGDLVELKSGGPKMTIQGLTAFDATLYECQWFGGKKLENGYFKGDSLKLASGE